MQHYVGVADWFVQVNKHLPNLHPLRVSVSVSACLYTSPSHALRSVRILDRQQYADAENGGSAMAPRITESRNLIVTSKPAYKVFEFGIIT